MEGTGAGVKPVSVCTGKQKTLRACLERLAITGGDQGGAMRLNFATELLASNEGHGIIDLRPHRVTRGGRQPPPVELSTPKAKPAD
jgi:hypothetical protein